MRVGVMIVLCLGLSGCGAAVESILGFGNLDELAGDYIGAVEVLGVVKDQAAAAAESPYGLTQSTRAGTRPVLQLDGIHKVTVTKTSELQLSIESPLIPRFIGAFVKTEKSSEKDVQIAVMFQPWAINDNEELQLQNAITFMKDEEGKWRLLMYIIAVDGFKAPPLLLQTMYVSYPGNVAQTLDNSALANFINQGFLLINTIFPR